MAESVPRHPVFVVGMPRSGTTLLSTLLDAHPHLTIAPETHYFTRCYTGTPVRSIDDAMRMVDRLFQQPGVRDMGLTKDEIEGVRQRVRGETRVSHAVVLRALIEQFVARSDASAWGEKTPNHWRYVPEMARQFPDAVFIAIVRDPRDVSLSLRSMPWNRDTVPEQAWTWRRYASRLEQYHAELPDRFFSLRYEDLISDPEGELRSVCTFLDTPFHETMLDRSGPDGQPFDAGREPWKEKSGRAIDASNREKWRAQMPEGERVLIELIAGRQLGDHGYVRPPIHWRPVLVARVLQCLATAGAKWLGRAVRNLRSGPFRKDDAAPRWLEE